jgi:hypothetical protein
VAGITGRLGRIANVTRQDTAALSREVPLDLAAIQEAWPAFESGFDSLRGRRMMGVIDNRAGRYRLCTERLPRDRENSLGLDETTIPGGRYLRLRLIGDPPGVYGQIAAAFDELFEHADHDPTRPLIEFYRREGEVDCLVPVNAAVLSPEHSSGITGKRAWLPGGAVAAGEAADGAPRRSRAAAATAPVLPAGSSRAPNEGREAR